MSTTKWVIDPTHSEIGFKVKHMMFTTISGKFSKFEASIESENDSFENAKIWQSYGEHLRPIFTTFSFIEKLMDRLIIHKILVNKSFSDTYFIFTNHI